MDKQCTILTFNDISKDIGSNVSVGIETNLVYHPKIENPYQSEYWKGLICCYVSWDDILIPNFDPYSIKFYISLQKDSINHAEIQKLVQDFYDNGGQTFGGTEHYTQSLITSINSNTAPSWLDPKEIFNVGEETTEFLVFNGAGPFSLSNPVKKLKTYNTIFVKGFHKGLQRLITYNSIFDVVTRVGKTFKKSRYLSDIMAAANFTYEIGGRYAYGNAHLWFEHYFNNNTIITGLQYEYVAYSDIYGVVGSGTFSFSGSKEWGPIPAYVEATQGYE